MRGPQVTTGIPVPILQKKPLMDLSVSLNGPERNPGVRPPLSLNFETISPSCLIWEPDNGGRPGTILPLKLGLKSLKGRSMVCHWPSSRVGKSCCACGGVDCLKLPVSKGYFMRTKTITHRISIRRYDGHQRAQK